MPTPPLRFEAVQSPAQIARAAALADEIWHECYAALLGNAQVDYMVGKFQSPAAIAAQLQNEGYAYFLLQGSEGEAGYIGIQADGGRLFLSKFYLRSQSRGKGYAGAVFAFLEEYAQQHGCHTLWLTVNRGNARAIAAYQKLGFATVRSQVADIGGGYVMDDYVMERALS